MAGIGNFELILIPASGHTVCNILIPASGHTVSNIHFIIASGKIIFDRFALLILLLFLAALRR